MKPLRALILLNVVCLCFSSASAFVCYPLISPVTQRRCSFVPSTSLLLTSSTTSTQNNEKLSRPQRKALERAKKEAQQRTTQKPKTPSFLSDWTVPRNYTIHDDFTSLRRAVQQAQSTRNVHRLRQLAEHCQNSVGIPHTIIARLLMAMMHCCTEQEERAISTLWSVWQNGRPDDSALRYRDAALLIRTALSVRSPDMAWSILATELPLQPRSNRTSSSSNIMGVFDRAQALISMAAFYFRHQQPLQALGTLVLLEQTGYVMVQQNLSPNSNATDVPERTLPWLRLLHEAAACQSWIRQTNGTQVDHPSASLPTDLPGAEHKLGIPTSLPSNVVYSVLSAMSALPQSYTMQCDRMYELISNALVRRVVFVTGAVSMAGCPPPDGGEVCFIGRSNVGKSSLINMVFNRKALAYTSKRPGKTQQFNFFTVNDIPAKEQEIKYGDDVSHLGQTKDGDSFTVVDLPGFGYAQVPEAQRQQWLNFMREYFRTRPNLRVIFHLIDSRHGPMKDDVTIMKQIGATLKDRSDDVSYVILLTKADKNVKGGLKSTATPTARSISSSGKVSKSVLMAVQNTIQECGINLRTTPIVLSSAETKLGRDDIWRLLEKATLPPRA